MNRYVPEEFDNEPALYARLAWLLDQVKARLTPLRGLRPSRWLARLG